jgi:CheY-like chemotaxis protein
MALSLEPVLVSEVLQQALGLIRPLAEQRSISISEGRDHRLNVHADRQRLRQVLLNLLSNAIKYNSEGGHIEVLCHTQESGLVRISVSDTGLGVSPEDRARLFRPFERLVGDSTAVEGTGLGLALSKGLVEAMGGAIGVESNPGGGSIFWIELRPAERTEDPWGDLDVVYERTPMSESSQPRVVLYIEDNPANLALMHRIAALRPDVDLMSAEQGDLGLDVARAHLPDLILLDLHLPDMPGLEVLRRLRQNPETEQIPVVVVSADATPEHIEELLAAGAQSYVTKPFDISSVLRLFDETKPRARAEPTAR